MKRSLSLLTHSEPRKYWRTNFSVGFFAILMLGLFFGFSSQASAATYNCVAVSGTHPNWSDTSGWTSCNSTYPHNNGGDTYTASSAYSRTLDVDLDIGSNGVTGTAAITQTAGTFAIGSHAITLRGDLIQNASTVTGGSDGSILFIPASGQTYIWNLTGGQGASSPVISLVGTSGHMFIINSDTSAGGGAGNGYISNVSGAATPMPTLTYVRGSNLGSATVYGIKLQAMVNITATMTHCIFSSCGVIDYQFLNGSNAYSIIIDGLDIRNPIGNVIAYYFVTNTLSSGTKTFSNITAYSSANKQGYIAIPGATISNVFHYNCYISLGQNQTLNNYVFIGNGISSGLNAITLAGNNNIRVHDSLFIYDYANPHPIVEQSPAAVSENLYYNNVFDGFNSSSS